ncbi:hypothetical protein RI129_009889 [Pyrocoelia pectoralis]|uniref:Uncharacterized protein n=1 Tax=Pyrocoelia pectoralis TaxID=417401 RepID=A0AAN7ZF99_9COLE
MTEVDQLFVSIENLEGKQLKLTEFVPYICTIYYEDVTPPEYAAPFFNQLSDEDIANITSWPKSVTTLSNINTGFHILKCLRIAKLNVSETSNECELHSLSIDNSDIQGNYLLKL